MPPSSRAQSRLCALPAFGALSVGNVCVSRRKASRSDREGVTSCRRPATWDHVELSLASSMDRLSASNGTTPLASFARGASCIATRNLFREPSRNAYRPIVMSSRRWWMVVSAAATAALTTACASTTKPFSPPLTSISSSSITRGSSCRQFSLSLAIDYGGQPSAIPAARWFANGHNGLTGWRIPASGWTVIAAANGQASVKSG